MKKLLLLTVLSTSIFFTNCKKKSDDPAPAVVINPYGNTSAITSNGVTTPLTTSEHKSGSSYSIIGDAKTGSYQSMTAVFYSGKPTQSSTVDLSTSTTFDLAYVTTANTLYATSGTAYVIVNDTAIVVSFTDATFTDDFGSYSVKYSGQLIVSLKTTGGGTTTSGGSGTATVGNGSASNLTVTSATSTSTGAYSVTGIIAGTSNSVMLLFPSGKPTSNSSENLSSSAKLYVAYNTSSTQYISTAGTATVSVSTAGAVTVTFTNATLTDGGGSATIKLSANMTATK